ncbi:EcsC family protein [Nonlabens antarcticus]|uniref:EcsC family protein n=1 Tax=Nonlabens antarcticus TaxID=392714 RepID=UPI001891B456|nr:EcsC family protein [Nonlabens antarcticus]
MELNNRDLSDLKKAVIILENPGIAARITNFIGSPIEKGLEMLPSSVQSKIGDITQIALLKVADAAIFTMKDTPKRKASNLWHKTGAAVSGGVGGFFGFAGLAVELPISTGIMLRSIADVARSEGESISAMETKLACLEVFALGGNKDSDDATESGYLIVRAALAKSVSEALQFTTGKAAAKEAAPAVINLISKIAQRFSIQVSEKVAAQAIPAIGALGGAAINTVFIDHFQDMAKGHFIVKRLERTYGSTLVQESYKQILRNEI